jgi:hypothetical protein
MLKVSILTARQSPEYDDDELVDVTTELEDSREVDVTFAELVSLLRDYPHQSDSHPDARAWAYSIAPDYRTGDELIESVHLHRDNPPGRARYWVKALRSAS